MSSIIDTHTLECTLHFCVNLDDSRFRICCTALLLVTVPPLCDGHEKAFTNISERLHPPPTSTYRLSSEFD